MSLFHRLPKVRRIERLCVSHTQRQVQQCLLPTPALLFHTDTALSSRYGHYLIFFFYCTPSCQHHKSIFLVRCLHDATQLGKSENRSRVLTSVLRGVMIGANGYIYVDQIGSLPRVTRCYYGSWVTVRSPWGAFLDSLPGYLNVQWRTNRDRTQELVFGC